MARRVDNDSYRRHADAIAVDAIQSANAYQDRHYDRAISNLEAVARNAAVLALELDELAEAGTGLSPESAARMKPFAGLSG